MKKYMYKSLIILILIATIILIYPTKVFAISKMFNDADIFLTRGKAVKDVISTVQLKDVSTTFYKIALAIAIVIAIIVGMVIGVKYIYESAEGQAKLKEAFVPYIVGCLIVFSAFPIWKLAISFGNDEHMLGGVATDGSDTKESYAKATNTNDLTSLTDEEILLAWTHVKILKVDIEASEVGDLDILYKINDVNDQDGYIFVEYIRRNYTKDQIKKIWEKRMERGNLAQQGWVAKFYELYVLASR